MKIIANIFYLFLLISFLQSCEIFSMDKKEQYEFILNNKTGEKIIIQSFLKGIKKDEFEIEAYKYFARITVDRFNNPSILIDNQIDSVSITTPTKSKSIYCNRKPLISSIQNCSELENSFVNIEAYDSFEINKKVNKTFISFQFSYNLESSFLE